MSDLMAMYAPDKVKISVLVPVEVLMKIRKRAKEVGAPLGTYINSMFYAATYKDPWTVQDEMERKRIIEENIKKRQASKAKRMAVKSERRAK